jgi:hypothetical protein
MGHGLAARTRASMSDVVSLEAICTPPDRASVLEAQGIPRSAKVSEHVLGLADRSIERYAELVRPRGTVAEITPEEFAPIYRGEGVNADRTPVEEIYPRAEHLALFAVTLGEAISEEVSALFRQNEPAEAYALDAVASERADAAAKLLARQYLDDLTQAGRVGASSRVLPYSPGYCGWHVTGQRRLFDRLKPQSIGVTLNSSCLMQPLKSVSGVLMVGPASSHDFHNDYDFCALCSTYQCRSRIASLTDTDRDRHV